MMPSICMYSLFSNKITIIVITIQINKENKKKNCYSSVPVTPELFSLVDLQGSLMQSSHSSQCTNIAVLMTTTRDWLSRSNRKRTDQEIAPFEDAPQNPDIRSSLAYMIWFQRPHISITMRADRENSGCGGSNGSLCK